MLSESKIIALYCIVDDLLKKLPHHQDSRVRISDAEVITTAFVAALYFSGHLDNARCFMKLKGYIPLMVEKSRFCRRLHRVSDLVLTLFYRLGQDLKNIAGASTYQMDSFPIAVCQNARISRSRIFTHKVFRGKHSSLGRYFYGVRVHILTVQGVPVELCIVPGSENDTNALYKLPLGVAPESCIYLDAGYNDYRAEDQCREAEGVYLKVERKSNARRKDSVSGAFIKNRMRKKVETTIALIKAKLPAHIHAVTKEGFLIKVALFVIAFSFEQVLP